MQYLKYLPLQFKTQGKIADVLRNDIPVLLLTHIHLVDFYMITSWGTAILDADSNTKVLLHGDEGLHVSKGRNL